MNLRCVPSPSNVLPEKAVTLNSIFLPTAQIMWDYFKQFRRDPETKKLIYLGH